MLLQQIINNELNKRLHRCATMAEQHNAYQVVSRNLGDNPDFGDLIDAMDYFIDNNYFRCDECGQLYLLDDKNEIHGPFGHFDTCSNTDCEQSAYYDANTNPYRESRPY